MLQCFFQVTEVHISDVTVIFSLRQSSISRHKTHTLNQTLPRTVFVINFIVGNKEIKANLESITDCYEIWAVLG